MTAWVSTSASEWPSRPSSCAMATPPRISGRPGASRCESQPMPVDGRHPIGSRRRSRRSKTASSPTPSSPSSRQRLVVVAAEVLGRVGVAGQRDRVAGVDHHLQERARRVQLADGLAQAGGGDLDRDARRGDRLDRDVVEAAQVAVGPRPPGGAPVLDEVRVGEDVEHPARRGLPQPLEVGPPHLLRASSPPTRCRRGRSRARRRRRSGSSRRRSRSRGRPAARPCGPRARG